MDNRIEFPTTKAQYAAAREAFLRQIWTGLEGDERFLAAWLSGSYGRGEQDEVSDIDLQVVVAGPDDRDLCRIQAPVASGSPPERLDLFSRFGEPVNIHENHRNAPQGGSFSAVLYRNPPVIVDWVLIPQTQAYRPADTRLLFDRAGIAVGNDPVLLYDLPGEPVDRRSERLAFFWMMAAVTAKYIVRGEMETVEELLVFVSSVAKELDSLVGREPEAILPTDHSQPSEQASRLYQLCQRMAGLGNKPFAGVEALLRLGMAG